MSVDYHLFKERGMVETADTTVPRERETTGEDINSLIFQ